jgi:hypothetical protein
MFNVKDVVYLRNGVVGLITQIHNENMYWCETCYPDGFHLGGASWFSEKEIERKVDEDIKIKIYKEWEKCKEDTYKKYGWEVIKTDKERFIDLSKDLIKEVK